MKNAFLMLISLLFSIKCMADPTYTKNIQPIFKNRCSICHDHYRELNWQVYENAFNHRLQIKDRVKTKQMPMGREMPQEERDLIIKWVDTGAKK